MMWLDKIQVHLVLLLIVLCSTSTAKGSPTEYASSGYAQEYTYPQYSFSYGVKDPHTGDVKHQWEKRNGDAVQGRYSLVEPDGRVRTVHYTADDKHGFNAVVKHSGPHYHPDGSTKPSSHSEVYIQKQNEPSQNEHAYYTPEESSENESSYSEQSVPEDSHIQYQYTKLETEDSNNLKSPKEVYSYTGHQQTDDTNNKKLPSHALQPSHTYFYLGNDKNLHNHHQIHSGNKNSHETRSSSKKHEPVRTSSKPKQKQKLPADLSLLYRQQEQAHNEHDEKLIPLEIAQIKPLELELDLSQLKDFRLQHQQPTVDSSLLQNPKQADTIDLSLLQEHGQLKYSPNFNENPTISEEELDTYLKQQKQFIAKDNSYLQSTKGYHFQEPEIEGGFKPITKSKPRLNNQRPGLINTGKKPHTTPGLRNYSTPRGHLKYNYLFPTSSSRGSQRKPYTIHNSKGPILFPPNPEERQAETPKLYQRVNSNGLLRYAKHVNYH